MRLRSDQVGRPMATSTPNAPSAKDEPEETRRVPTNRNKPTIREEVQLRPSLKVVIRAKPSDDQEVLAQLDAEDSDETSEGSYIEATPPPTPTPTEGNTGADADRAPLLRAVLSQSTPVGGGHSAPGYPDVDTVQTKCPEDRDDRATKGAAANDSVTVRYPGTEVECVVLVSKMLEFLDQQGLAPE